MGGGRDGVQIGSINVRVQQERVLLLYRVRRNGGDWQDIEEPVSLAWTQCYYGGQRPWFTYPGVVKGRVWAARGYSLRSWTLFPLSALLRSHL